MCFDNPGRRLDSRLGISSLHDRSESKFLEEFLTNLYMFLVSEPPHMNAFKVIQNSVRSML
jgi:hypothetical protein